MEVEYFVSIKDLIGGPVVRKITILALDPSAYSVACGLMRFSERNLTVLFGEEDIDVLVLTGRHKGGWYTGHGDYPVCRSTKEYPSFLIPKDHLYVPISEKIGGRIIRKIQGISPFCSAHNLAYKLMHAGERDLTVTSNLYHKLGKRVQAELSQNASLPLNAYRRAGYVLAGLHMEGWYTGHGNYPVYLQTPQGQRIFYHRLQDACIEERAQRTADASAEASLEKNRLRGS